MIRDGAMSKSVFKKLNDGFRMRDCIGALVLIGACCASTAGASCGGKTGSTGSQTGVDGGSGGSDGGSSAGGCHVVPSIVCTEAFICEAGAAPPDAGSTLACTPEPGLPTDQKGYCCQ
jgi:hypothetical protein